MRNKRVLVDTSAWIVSFKKKGNDELKEFLKHSLQEGTAATNELIILELLQGCRNREEFQNLKTRLESLDRVEITKGVWGRTFSLGFSLRRKGIIIPTVDLVIACLAMENDCLLLHRDRRFTMMRSYSALQAVDFLKKKENKL
jgi:predicted nucleic acid-binding protein